MKAKYEVCIHKHSLNICEDFCVLFFEPDMLIQLTLFTLVVMRFFSWQIWSIESEMYPKSDVSFTESVSFHEGLMRSSLLLRVLTYN